MKNSDKVKQINPNFTLFGGGAQWEKGGNFKKLKMSKITRYNVYGLQLDESKRIFEVNLKIDWDITVSKMSPNKMLPFCKSIKTKITNFYNFDIFIQESHSD